ncbi:MAG: hypothetical protein JWO30_623 [Fibrobacteres bacterium]|nr:hypothetical protein [Fibrobacterota bacterium]
MKAKIIGKVSRITRRFNLPSLGRHGVCSGQSRQGRSYGKPRAGDPPHPSIRAGRSGLVRRLIGRYTDKGKKKEIMEMASKDRVTTYCWSASHLVC